MAVCERRSRSSESAVSSDSQPSSGNADRIISFTQGGAADVSPFPAGSATGKIVLIERGVCNFSDKVFNAQRAGAIAAFVYNNAAGGDTVMTMGGGTHQFDVLIPSWFLGRTNGLNMVAFANATPLGMKSCASAGTLVMRTVEPTANFGCATSRRGLSPSRR